jgi:glycosyltransferase involved in cell wall biosynthesis
VYHGLPEELYTFHAAPGDYLAFLGRISPEKRVDRAIEIAKRVRMPLKIAAKVDPADQAYFESTIQPLLHDPLVDYMGEIGERDKDDFLGQAYALLFPIDWPEPFGLVLTEALACGTPVIAFRHGSVPELIEDGVTGFIVSTVEEAVQAVSQVPTVSRGCCRQVFEERFSVTRMVEDYLQIYHRLVEKRLSHVAA